MFVHDLFHEHPSPATPKILKLSLTKLDHQLGVLPCLTIGQPLLKEVLQGVLGTSVWAPTRYDVFMSRSGGMEYQVAGVKN